MLDVNVKVFRAREGEAGHFQNFKVSVPDDANVIDVIDAVWRQDPSFMFRHACHHASCGTCAVRVNGYEKLPCIYLVKDAMAGRSEMTLEPLRNFPIVGDMVVDVSGFFQKQIESGMVITRQAETALEGQAYARAEIFSTEGKLEDRAYNRFENCVECGICISACPTMAATDKFFGPAGLAAINRAYQETSDPAEKERLLNLADDENGVWRCHSGWECTEACPQNVDPAGAIMQLRRKLIGRRIKGIFKLN